MINIILAILSVVVGCCGYQSQPLDSIPIYRDNGSAAFTIDNISQVVYLYPFGYIITFSFHPDSYDIVYNFRGDYWAISVSPEGIRLAEY